MAMLKTLLLDQTAWDLVLDSAGNIALASPPYALTQDVASAIRLFLGELWYNTEKGIPYFEDVLGQLPPASLLIGYMEEAAKSVPGVVTVQVFITQFSGRQLQGELQFIDEAGAENNITF